MSGQTKKARYRIRVIPYHRPLAYKQTASEWDNLTYRVNYSSRNGSFIFITKLS